MQFKLEDWNGQNFFYVISYDQSAESELCERNINHWYIEDNQIKVFPENIIIPINDMMKCQLSSLHNYDVVGITREGNIRRYYNDNVEDMVLLVTERCNSNCIMCPSPEHSRYYGKSSNLEFLSSLLRYLPTDVSHFTITGGEPFLVGEKIFPFFRTMKEKFRDSEILLLTNGRIFAVEKYCEELKRNISDNFLCGIPLYASKPEIHDAMTQAKGSYAQTTAGISNLLKKKIDIEIRVVVTKINYKHLVELAQFISDHFKGISHVSIMAMELTGNARKYSETVWISYKTVESYVKEAAECLIKNGIDVWLYNFPLCAVHPSCWTLCKKSISYYKVRYFDECQNCSMKSACGGVFSGSKAFEQNEIMRIL